MIPRALAFFAVIALIAGAGAAARADEETYRGQLVDRNVWTTKDLVSIFQDVTGRIGSMSPDRAEGACNPSSPAPGKTRDARCIQKYLDIYDKPITDMRVVLGYKDDAGETQDKYLKEALVAKLTAPCRDRGRDFSCEFTRDRDDADLFYKKITDPNGQPRLIKLTLVDSSYTVSDEANKGRYRAEQEAKTERTRQVFLDGLRHADIVLYNGHSRYGGGPDFAPPRLLADGKRDSSWYRRNRPGVKDMVQALGESDRGGPKVLGLMSCYSLQELYPSIKEKAPGSSFLLSRGYLWWNDEPDVLLGAINGLVGQFCGKALSGSMRDPRMDPGVKIQLVNFP